MGQAVSGEGRGSRATVELISPTPQRLWRWPAVLNFGLGGLGAGLYAVAAVAAAGGAIPGLGAAGWLGPALVLTGFAAVATEAGRPLRGARVLARVRSSWMSRELWIGGAFVALAAADLALPGRWLRLPAVAAALGLAAAQGAILREARGVAAWNVGAMPLLFVASAAVSGGGLLVTLEVAAGRRPGALLLGLTVLLLAAGLPVWQGFVSRRRDPAFVRSTRTLREGWPGTLIVGGAYAAPALLLGLAVVLPDRAAVVAGAAGGLAIAAGQVYAKAHLILRAGHLRAITIENLRLHRRVS